MFWGLALQPNSSQGLGDKVDGGILHLSQACLSNTKPGKNYLEVEVEGSKYRICCLEQDKVEHISCDLFFGDKETTFYNKGASQIHLTGYIEPEDDEMDEDEEEEEEAAAPPAKTKAATPKAKPAASPKVEPKASPKVEPKTSPKVSPKAEPKASPKAEPKASPKAAAKKAPEEDDDDDSEGLEEGEEEELEGEEEELEDEEEEEEDEPPAPKAAAKSGAKRKETPAAEPPAKKKKGEAGGASAKAGDPVADYLSKLKAYLKENGKTNLGQLGSKVPKPDGVPKLGKLLGEHKDKFKIENQMVSAV